MRAKKFISLFLLLVFLLAINSKEAHADWVDQSDDLPGMSDSNGLLIAAGAAVVLVGGFLIYKNIQKKQKIKVQESATKLKNLNNITMMGNAYPNNFYEFQKYAAQSPVQFFTDYRSLEFQKYTNQKVFTVGIKIRF